MAINDICNISEHFKALPENSLFTFQDDSAPEKVGANSETNGAELDGAQTGGGKVKSELEKEQVPPESILVDVVEEGNKV